MLDTKSGQNKLMFFLENKFNITQIFESVDDIGKSDINKILNTFHGFSIKI